MGYYTGKGLERQLRRHGLTSFEEEVRAVAAGRRQRVVHVAVDNPEEIGKVRLLLYSILHAYGLKERYRIEAKGNVLTVKPVVRTKIFTVEEPDTGMGVQPIAVEEFDEEDYREILAGAGAGTKEG
ncbi:MAG: hypothetical protein N3E40_02045 [Dehalococcoidia bacterium]|nr:hypothetical protein [Dehalococcoidia bacterium]